MLQVILNHLGNSLKTISLSSNGNNRILIVANIAFKLTATIIQKVKQI